MSTVDSIFRIEIFHICMSLFESTLMSFCKPQLKLDLLKLHQGSREREKYNMYAYIYIYLHIYEYIFYLYIICIYIYIYIYIYIIFMHNMHINTYYIRIMYLAYDIINV